MGGGPLAAGALVSWADVRVTAEGSRMALTANADVRSASLRLMPGRSFEAVEDMHMISCDTDTCRHENFAQRRKTEAMRALSAEVSSGTREAENGELNAFRLSCLSHSFEAFVRNEMFVGCSGWFYWHWKQLFYPADLPTHRWFEHYRYRYDYSGTELALWADRIATSGARQASLYFNNDPDAIAVANAASLRTMIEPQPSRGVPPPS